MSNIYSWKGAVQPPATGWSEDYFYGNYLVRTDYPGGNYGGGNWSRDGATTIDDAASYTDEQGTVIPFTQITADTSTGQHVIERINHFGNNLRIPEDLMVSCYCKAGTSSYVVTTPSNVNFGHIFDMSSETWTRKQGEGVGNYGDMWGWQNKGNGFYRIWWVHHEDNLHTADPDYCFGVAKDGLNVDFTGTGIESVLLGGFQIEPWRRQQSEPSPYVANNTGDRDLSNTWTRYRNQETTSHINSLYPWKGAIDRQDIQLALSVRSARTVPVSKTNRTGTVPQESRENRLHENRLIIIPEE
jgi:hypothetical protein